MEQIQGNFFDDLVSKKNANAFHQFLCDLKKKNGIFYNKYDELSDELSSDLSNLCKIIIKSLGKNNENSILEKLEIMYSLFDECHTDIFDKVLCDQFEKKEQIEFLNLLSPSLRRTKVIKQTIFKFCMKHLPREHVLQYSVKRVFIEEKDISDIQTICALLNLNFDEKKALIEYALKVRIDNVVLRSKSIIDKDLAEYFVLDTEGNLGKDSIKNITNTDLFEIIILLMIRDSELSFFIVLSTFSMEYIPFIRKQLKIKNDLPLDEVVFKFDFFQEGFSRSIVSKFSADRLNKFKENFQRLKQYDLLYAKNIQAQVINNLISKDKFLYFSYIKNDLFNEI